MKTYNDYKDSEISWLDKIPSHWKEVKLKREFEFTVGGTPTSGNANYYADNENEGFKWATIGDIKGKTINETSSYVSKEGIRNTSMKLIPKGSLLFSFKLSIGQVAFTEDDMYTNEAIASFEVDKNINNLKYFYYALPIYVVQNANENIYGAKLLNQELIKNAYIAIPPIEEQEYLANYLDKKVCKIDELINQKLNLLDTIKKAKKKLIYETVTKGISKNMPKKSSEISWLDNVPSHWKEVKLKREFEFTVGGTPTSGNANYYADNENEGFKWATIGDIKGKTINETSSYVSKEGIRNTSMKLIPKGSLLFSFKLSIGQVAFTEDDMYTNEAIASFEVDKNINNLKYFYYALPIYVVQNANENIYGAKLLNQELIKNAYIAIPPIEEQEYLAEFLDEKISNIDELILLIENQIEVIEKAKKRLILEVVTGKRRVVN